MALLLMMAALAATPERDSRLAAAIAQYDAASFARARSTLASLIDARELSAADRAGVLTYFAACELALGDADSARLHLQQLARELPSAKPSAAVFKPDFVRLANEVWAELEA